MKEALKNVVEKKLMGTWKLALMSLHHPSAIYLVKNSGDFILGKGENSIVVSSEPKLLQDHDF